MTKYNGPIKTKRQAELLANKIEAGGGDAGMVSMLRNRWEVVAARPALALMAVDMASHARMTMDARRSGSVANRMMGGAA